MVVLCHACASLWYVCGHVGDMHVLSQISCCSTHVFFEVYLFQGQILVQFFSQDPTVLCFFARGTLGSLHFWSMFPPPSCPLSSFMCTGLANTHFSRNLRKIFTFLSEGTERKLIYTPFSRKLGTQIFSHLQCLFLCQVVLFQGFHDAVNDPMVLQAPPFCYFHYEPWFPILLMGTCQVALFRIDTCGFEQLHPWEPFHFQGITLFQGRALFCLVLFQGTFGCS